MKAEDFHSLYERYASDVFRFAMYLCRNRAQAEDITAEAFVRVWTTSGEIRVATVKAYLLTIARNLYLSDLRWSVREVALEEAGQVPDYEGNLACHADQKAALDHVLQALGQLKENDRAVLLMRAQEEMSYEQIAQALGLSMVAVKVRIHRARLRLAELCQRKEGRA